MPYSLKSNFVYIFNKSLNLSFFVIIIILALLIDMEISNQAHLIYEDISTEFGIGVFVLISLIFLVSQQYILGFANKEPFQIKVKSTSFGIIQRIISFMVFFIVVCLLTIILEIIISHYYDTFLLLLLLVITNAVTIIAMGTMALKFFKWYKSNTDHTILIFGTMYCVIAVTAFVTVLFMGMVLMDQPKKIEPNITVTLKETASGTTLLIINYLYYYLAVISYVITWVVTSLLLKDYVSRIGKWKYWLVLSLPLVFYLSQLLVTQFGLFIPQDTEDNITFQKWFLLFYTPSSLVGGLLFSIPFYLIMKKTWTSKPLQNFLRITVYGLILFFAAGSATVYHTPYPPYGLLTVAVIGPSSYLIALGIYYSARIISRNRTIETQMKKSEKYSQFFASIGSAETEAAMTEIVEEIRKKLPSEDTAFSQDIESVDKEIIKYLKEYQARKKTGTS